ncbi:MAG: response regulator, partial [Calothrix sp. SM1_7_51]|nr:response regulator [Calothrix sp. SM1_7_51]
MKILVVEDDILVSEALAAILTNQNYAVETAADGELAWDLINTYDYDLVLLDVILPKLDGISLCRQIRTSGLQMPILLLTGRDSSHEKAVGLNAGADDYVVKPFDEEELLARIHALFRRGIVSSQPILEFGELRLDPSSCEVAYNQQILTLTPKEYALLELFMRNSKRVFSCSMILEHLWSYEETPGEDAVRTHIKGLRHKLKAAGAASDLIDTVYGIGYRLKPVNCEPEKAKQKKSKNLAANSSSEQKSLSAVAGIWQKFKGRVEEQVNVLARAAEAVNDNTLDNTLDTELRALAKQEAHTLAGSLGTFGFAYGSKIAREIENLLLIDKKFASSDAKKLKILVQQLQQEIATDSQPSQESGDLSKDINPVTLIVDSQPEIIKEITQEANILAVDDDPKILAILQTLLVPWGLKVHTLDNPNRFWETLEATKPDLLILDVEMPEISGIELCQVVRHDPDWNDLPILFLTVHNDATTLNQVFSTGADDFVSKPLVGPELVTRIINRLERNKLRRRMVKTHHRINQTLETLQRTNQDLELRVAKRTAELVQANQNLQLELEERLRSQEALRNSQALFAGIINIADDAIISIDSKQKITLFNSGAEKIFGYCASSVLGKSLDLLIPKRYIQAHKKHVDEFGKSPGQARKMGERQEIYARRKDGSEFPAEASISKLNQGEEIIYTVYLQDISDRKQIERMKDEFVSVVSHELRTPLTSIHGSLGMLASGLIKPESEQGKRLLQIATDSTERLVRLINDILDIERIKSGKVRMEKQSCNVADLIDKAVNV